MEEWAGVEEIGTWRATKGTTAGTTLGRVGKIPVFQEKRH